MATTTPNPSILKMPPVKEPQATALFRAAQYVEPPTKYVVAPQDLPPLNPVTGKRGFFNPKYRMSTLQAKGFSVNQILFAFSFSIVAGFCAQYNVVEWRNSRAMVLSSETVAQRSVFDVFYGPPTAPEYFGSPVKEKFGGMNPLFFLPGLLPGDQRPSTFVMDVANDEKRQKVAEFRLATFDEKVAPYHICYGPEHYNTPHVCNSYCIAPEEVKAVREIADLKNKANKAKI